MKSSCIYITGASGFVGKNLIKALKKKNIIPYCVSRKKIKNYNSIIVKNYGELSPKKNSILVHLAENNNISEVNLLGQSYIHNNVRNLRSLLEKGWKHVIYISSIIVQQEAKKKSTYKKSKEECEKIILQYDGTILRMTNLYGPYMSTANVFSDIIKQLDNELIILNNIRAVRDFLWIDDAVEAIISAINKKPGGIYNVASGKSTSIEDIVKYFIKIYKVKHNNILSVQKKKNELFSYIDISKTKEVLDWHPNLSIETGIKKLLKYS